MNNAWEAEVGRLRGINKELVEAIKGVVECNNSICSECPVKCQPHRNIPFEKMQAALKKAGVRP
jgi:aldehyde:ferredoxin oxidoreductase